MDDRIRWEKIPSPTIDNNSDLPDAVTVMEHLPVWLEDYNENHPHKGLKMLSPREFRRKEVKLETRPV